jgi:hypothetical protein
MDGFDRSNVSRFAEKNAALKKRATIAWLILAMIGASLPASGREVWFVPPAPFPVPVTGRSANDDYLALFQPGAAWQHAAAGVTVFKMATQSVLAAPDDVLAGMLAFLHAHRIAFAIEGLMLSEGAQGCGHGVEGYSGAATLAIAAAKVKRLGGVLGAVAMDEPLWFGHFADGPTACHSTIPAIAADVAKTVAAIHGVFPDTVIGDIEPITSFKDVEFADAMRQWTDAFAAATGQKLAFFDADLDWSKPWRPRLRDFAETLKERGIAFGIIYDGDADEPTDLAWTTHAQQRFVDAESDPATRPDRAIIQSWMDRPRRNLPDTLPGTLSNLVVQYLKPAAGLTLRRTPVGVTGRLVDANGNPVAGAAIVATVSDRSGPGLPSRQSLSRAVPAGAARALIALRINAECECSGRAALALGNLTFQENGQAPVTIPAAQVAGPLAIGNPVQPSPIGPMIPFTVAKTQPVVDNSKDFPVTPDGLYTLTVPSRVSASSAGSGYLAVIFLDRTGKEIRRDQLPLRTGAVPLTGVRTDRSGKFALAVPGEHFPPLTTISARFAGNGELRPAEAVLP